MAKTRIYLVDDHPIILEGLRRAIDAEQDMCIVGSATDGRTALDQIGAANPDIAILDIEMPGMSGTVVAGEVVRQGRAKVIVLSAFDGIEYLRAMLALHVAGYLLKGCEMAEVLKAIRVVRDGNEYMCPQVAHALVNDYRSTLREERRDLDMLSIREREVLGLVAEGMGRLDIARKLSVDAKTVDRHRQNIMEKLGLDNVADLTKFAVAHGISSLKLGKHRMGGAQAPRQE